MKRAGWRRTWWLAAAAAATFAAGCSAAKPVPAPAGSCPGWTRGEKLPAWPRTRALLGFGTARATADRARAEEEARATAWADIARQIEVSVQSESKLAIWDSSDGDSGQNAREELRVRTSLALDSAEIVAHCYEPETSTVYVLAALEREKFAARGGARIRELNALGTSELARSRELAASGKLLEAAGSASRALDAARSAEQVGRLVRAVSGAAPQPFEPVATVAAWNRELRTGAKVRVMVDAAHQSVEQAVLQAITASGFDLAGSDEGEPVAILVNGRVEDMGISRPDFGKFLISRVRVVAQVTRADTGAVIGAVDRQESGGGLTEQLAREQAQAALAKTFSAEVANILQAALSATK